MLFDITGVCVDIDREAHTIETESLSPLYSAILTYFMTPATDVKRSIITLYTIEAYTSDTPPRNPRHIDFIYLAAVSGLLVRVSCKSGTGVVWYQIPAPIRTLFYSKPETDMHMTEMSYNRLFFLSFPANIIKYYHALFML